MKNNGCFWQNEKRLRKNVKMENYSNAVIHNEIWFQVGIDEITSPIKWKYKPKCELFDQSLFQPTTVLSSSI